MWTDFSVYAASFLPRTTEIQIAMSYAGPVSRGRRAPDLDAPGSTFARAMIPRKSAARSSMAPRPSSATETSSSPLVFGAGVAVGLLVGMSAALLFAPASGADTRHAIARRGRKLRRRSRDAWDDLRHEFRYAVARRKRELLDRHHDHDDDD